MHVKYFSIEFYSITLLVYINNKYNPTFYIFFTRLISLVACDRNTPHDT